MTNLAKIGLFFLVIGVSSVGYILMTVDSIAGGDGYAVTVFMDDASGLIEHSGVQMAGVQVGQIRSIELQNGRAKLVLEIREDVEIYPDAVVRKRPSSVLGNSVLSIDPGQRTGAPVEAGYAVRTVESNPDLSAALGSVQDAGTEAALLIRSIRTQLATDATYENFDAIVGNRRETSETTRFLLEQNLQLLTGTLQSIDEVAGQVNSRSVQEARAHIPDSREHRRCLRASREDIRRERPADYGVPGGRAGVSRVP